jgi:predicted nucleic acid-binding protein
VKPRIPEVKEDGFADGERVHLLAARARCPGRAFWRDGQIRAVGSAGLLIAAVAERGHVTVPHYDSDYDLIAKITGQAARWVVTRGTVP